MGKITVSKCRNNEIVGQVKFDMTTNRFEVYIDNGFVGETTVKSFAIDFMNEMFIAIAEITD